MAERLTSVPVRTNIATEPDVGPRRFLTKTYKEQVADQFAQSSVSHSPSRATELQGCHTRTAMT
jgi:hypothetical protein